jgi:N-acetylglutamate synthase-like GNAT family acetyltransferase
VSFNDSTKLPVNISIRSDLKPGDVGYLTCLHGVLYTRERGWDHTFEAYVAGPLAEFAKAHSARERIWIVENNGTVAGSLAIVEAASEQAQLRWFLLHPGLREQGLGRTLMEEAISFCKKNGYSMIYLWTTNELTAAARLYGLFGFHITQEITHKMWGATVTEQRYELDL